MAPLPTALKTALSALDAAAPEVERRRQYFAGDQPAGYLGAKSRQALAGRLRRLVVNYPRVVVQTLGERLDLIGVTRDGDDDAHLWAALCAAGIGTVAAGAHVDRLAYGCAFVIAWRTPAGRLVLDHETPARAWADVDPMTGDVLAGARVWNLPGSAGRRALLLLPDRIETWQTHVAGDGSADSTWTRVDVGDHWLGRPPIVPMVRRLSAGDDQLGTPAAADIFDLTDALAKVIHDALVTSEYFARPRRWATGLEIEEDDDGRPVDPFGESRLLQSEDPETRFGQLDPPSMSGYGELTATITQQIGALTGLPPHYLGLTGDQPASSDAIAAAENQLVQRADSEVAGVTPAWRRVLELVDALRTGVPADALRHDLAPVWADTQSRTPAQEADAAAKLAGIGVPLRDLLARLRYTPAEAERIAAAADQAALINALRPRGS